MKKSIHFILLLCGICLAVRVLGQDRVLGMNGEEWQAHVLEITIDSVYYRVSADTAEAVKAVPKADVFMITFRNGSREVLYREADPEQQLITGEQPLTNEQLFEKGRRDALHYYRGKGAYWGTLGATLVYPPVGLIAGAAFVAAPPPENKIRTAEPQLVQYQAYRAGYKNQVRKRKVGQVAAGAGTALGVYALIIIIAVVSMF